MQKTLGTRQHKALVELIIQKRIDAGLTQTDIAKSLNVYQSFVARLESGQRRIDIVELIALSKILKFDVLAVVKSVDAISND